MRIGILSDIHGNLPALETAVKALRHADVDQIVCLGDVAVAGPQPHETVAYLRQLGCLVVMGNTDQWALAPHPYEIRNAETALVNAVEMWGANQLSPADLDYLRTFQPTVQLSMSGGMDLLCYHGTPKSNLDRIDTSTPDDTLADLLSSYDVTLFAGGHSHMQMLRRLHNKVIINPGSIGYPIELTPDGRMCHPPWAEYALVTWQNSALDIDLRRIPYDVGALLRAAESSNMPHVDWWISRWKSCQ